MLCWRILELKPSANYTKFFFRSDYPIFSVIFWAQVLCLPLCLLHGGIHSRISLGRFYVSIPIMTEQLQSSSLYSIYYTSILIYTILCIFKFMFRVALNLEYIFSTLVLWKFIFTANIIVLWCLCIIHISSSWLRTNSSQYSA